MNIINNYVGGTGIEIERAWNNVTQKDTFLGKVGQSIVATGQTIAAPVTGMLPSRRVGFAFYEGMYDGLEELIRKSGDIESMKKFKESTPWIQTPTGVKTVGAISIGVTLAAIAAGVAYACTRSSDGE